MDNSQALAADVLIAGGGLAGLTLALALADAGFTFLLAEPQPQARMASTAYDGRTTALSAASVRLFRRLGLSDPALWPGSAGVDGIEVSEGPSAGFLPSPPLCFDREEVSSDALAVITENRRLRSGLLARLEAQGVADCLLTERSLDVFTADRQGVTARLSDGSTVAAKMLIACDGRNSPVRRQLKIATQTKSYGQLALIGNVTHSAPHCGVAAEAFLQTGPLALLPMADADDGQPQSSLIWNCDTQLAQELAALDDVNFLAQLQRRFGDRFGAFTGISHRAAFPLSAQIAKTCAAGPVALTGDAAHVIHPLAGQGFNLTVRDVAVLMEELTEMRETGRSAEATLAAYSDRRSADIRTLFLATDGLSDLFAIRHGPLAAARRLGLAAVAHIGPLKRALMKEAMGEAAPVIGDLPPLMRPL